MRCLIISDIHANLAAFEAVLADAGDFDLIWCLGDTIGYGPDPNECIALLRRHPHICLSGNHDWAALGKLDLRGFNADARTSIEWTHRHITPATRAYLQALPPSIVQSGYTMAHGSPRQPVWEYILDPLTAERNFKAFKTDACLVGHTHVPAMYFLPDGEPDRQMCEPREPEWRHPIHLNSGRWIVNPGSVGQPRDGNPDASYAMLDLEEKKWEHRRIAYPIEITQRRMRQQDLPPRLVERLAQGH
jgi:predicted phosphodiesterase